MGSREVTNPQNDSYKRLPLTDYRLELHFDNGEFGIVDLSSLAGQGVFMAWNEPGVFEQVMVTPAGAVEWPGEIDMCPDALYLRMKGKSIDARTNL